MTSQPTTIDRFQIVEPIGQGGMGTLYLAWDPKLDRHVAIKLLKEDDPQLRERFSREARAAARLRHLNVVTIFDVGEHAGQPFIAMEYVEGVTLAQLIREQRPLATTRKIELVEQLCDGLAFAHRCGIVHRDVKPANLMVSTEGPLKILDFGIARSIHTTGMTQAGYLIGTLNYMSPEQMGGHPVDPRSDVFAVGVVCYELLAYRQAFPGGLANGLYQRILFEPAPALAGLVRDLDPELIGIVERAMEKEARHRYQDLVTMRDELRRVRARLEPTIAAVTVGEPLSMAPTIAVEAPVPARASRPAPTLTARLPGPGARRSAAFQARWRFAAIAAVVLAGLAGSTWLVSSKEKDLPPPTPREVPAQNPAETPLLAAPAPPEPPPPEPPPPEPVAVPVPAPPPVRSPAPDRGKPATSAPAEPVLSGEPGPRSDPVPPECVKLLERLSLGEELTEDEQAFLKRRCRK